jgi:hypothetical protein
LVALLINQIFELLIVWDSLMTELKKTGRRVGSSRLSASVRSILWVSLLGLSTVASVQFASPAAADDGRESAGTVGLGVERVVMLGESSPRSEAESRVVVELRPALFRENVASFLRTGRSVDVTSRAERYLQERGVDVYTSGSELYPFVTLDEESSLLQELVRLGWVDRVNGCMCGPDG